jgi:hypothetical protein
VTQEASLLEQAEFLASLAGTFVTFTWAMQRILGRSFHSAPREPKGRVSPIPLIRSLGDSLPSDRQRHAA